ncbi:MAG: hypothetical protein WCX28_11520 [Bacteriovoracaceae bacterium]|nr:hypothetical protein [Bacteroidota bacterium]
MRCRLFIALFFVGTVLAQDSPHGNIRWKCIDCHSTEGWKELVTPMKFDHAATAFVLYGQHRSATCRECHSSLQFIGTSTLCISCHQNDFNNTVSIDHRKAGFSTDCIHCHRIDALEWKSSFDHNKTQFPIRGIHEAVGCQRCHTNSMYRGTRSECVACHRKEYDASTNPNHSTAGFPTDCATCHRALTWQPAVFFPHAQYFPIGSGDTHRPGRWNSCTDCHTAAPNYSIFECTNCHEHSRSSVDGEHDDVTGYVYQSVACYRCHPSGEGD